MTIKPYFSNKGLKSNECLLLKKKTNNKPLLTSFKKNHSTQHCLLTMLEKWINKQDKKIL